MPDVSGGSRCSLAGAAPRSLRPVRPVRTLLRVLLLLLGGTGAAAASSAPRLRRGGTGLVSVASVSAVESVSAESSTAASTEPTRTTSRTLQSSVVRLPVMFLGVVVDPPVFWCDDSVARSVRATLLECLVTQVPSECGLTPDRVGLGTASCSTNDNRLDTGVWIDSGSMEFAPGTTTTVPSEAALSDCVLRTVRSGTCAAGLTATLPWAESLTYGSRPADPTPSPTQGRLATPAPSTRFPTVAPTMGPTMAPTTASPTGSPTMVSSPTGSPTGSPTTAPTKLPSTAPSTAPSTRPSLDPASLASPPPSNNNNSTNDTPNMTAASSMSTLQIALAAVGASLLVLACAGGVALLRRTNNDKPLVTMGTHHKSLEEDDEEDVNDYNNNHDLPNHSSGLSHASSQPSSGAEPFSASVSHIYKSSDDSSGDHGLASPPRRHRKTGFLLFPHSSSSAASSSATTSPARPEKSLTEQDHLADSSPDDSSQNVTLPAVVEEQDPSEQPTISRHTPTSVPFQRLRETDIMLARTMTESSLDSMQHSDSEVSSSIPMTLSDSSAELVASVDGVAHHHHPTNLEAPPRRRRQGRGGMMMKAYRSITPSTTPEQAQQRSFLWRRKDKKEAHHNFYPLYSKADDDSDDDDDDESGDPKSHDSTLNVTDYEPDANWNPDDNSVSSSDRGEEIFSPTSSNEDALILRPLPEESIEEAVEVVESGEDSALVPMDPQIEAGYQPLEDSADMLTDGPVSPSDSRELVEYVGAPVTNHLDASSFTTPRAPLDICSPSRSNSSFHSAQPSTGSSLSSGSNSQSSPRKTPGSHSSSLNSSLSSGGDGHHHGASPLQPTLESEPEPYHHRPPPLSPNKRARYVIDPLSEHGPAVFGAQPTPTSHFADTGSHTDKPAPPGARDMVVRPASPQAGFLMHPLSTEYAEV